MAARLTDEERRLRAITEAAWQEQVIQIAQLRGWMVAHFRPAQNSRGEWRTAVAADGAGFPDLVLARRGIVFFVELKRQTGRVTDAQASWLTELGANTYVWRPSDWPTVQRVLA